MPLAELIEQYAAGPARVRKAVAGLSREELLARPIPGKWSSLEVIAHIADFEVVFVDRLTSVIAENSPTIPGRDEQKYAARLAYHQRDLDEQLRLIEICRAHVTRILRTLTDADLARVGNHTEAGPLTLEQLLDRIIKHLLHHVKFIDDKRAALGK
jgi:uncharacterized damage-inducible protein DinB